MERAGEPRERRRVLHRRPAAPAARRHRRRRRRGGGLGQRLRGERPEAAGLGQQRPEHLGEVRPAGAAVAEGGAGEPGGGAAQAGDEGAVLYVYICGYLPAIDGVSP